MNHNAPREIIDAVLVHAAGPFQPVYKRDVLEVLSRHERVSYARVQYFPKATKYSRAIGVKGLKLCRGEAWEILSRQQIPGCPDDGQNHWRKMHTENYWAWYYEAGI